jgi:hypothetical protein
MFRRLYVIRRVSLAPLDCAESALAARSFWSLSPEIIVVIGGCS